MNLKNSFLGGLVSLVLAANVSAVSLTVSDAYYVGSIVDGINSNSTNETNWINDLILLSPGATGTSATIPVGQGPEALTRSSNVFASLPSAVFIIKDEDNDLSLMSLTGIDYILGKYGAGNDSTQFSRVWYVGGLSGTGHTIFDTSALSHVSYFGGGGGDIPGVPDGGSAVLMLGVALVGLSMIRRKLVS